MGWAFGVGGLVWGLQPSAIMGPVPMDSGTIYAPPAQVHTVAIPGNYIEPSPAALPAMVVDVDGFLELKFMRRNQSPSTATGQRLSVIRQSYAYQQLPPDIVANTAFRNDNRYDLSLTGQYGDAMSIRFRVSKEPDFDMITDILMKYKTAEVFLGDFTTSLSNGEFLNLNRSLNGLSVQGNYGSQWGGHFVMGREKSKPKRVTFYGNGGTDYPLPNRNLLDGSVKVLINNQETAAYRVNYTTGSLIFDSPKTDAQFIKVLYEFTNPIADFLPAARSRKSFIGGEFEWKPPRTSWQEPVVNRVTVTHPEKSVIQLGTTNAVVGSETVTLIQPNGREALLQSVVDYDFDYRDGHLRIKYPIASTHNALKIAYNYYDVQTQTETIIANDSRGPFYLEYASVIPRSVTIQLNNRIVMEQYDYTVNYYTGQVYFAYPIRHPDTIKIQYETIRQNTRYGDANEPNNRFQIKGSYMNEFVRADDKQSPTITETVIASGNQVLVSHNPVDLTTVQVMDGANSVLNIDTDTSSAYDGTITGANIQSGTQYSVTYAYRSSQPMIGVLRLNQSSGEAVVYASDSLGDSLSLPALPVNKNSIQRVVVNPGSPSAIELNAYAYAVRYLNQGNKLEIQFFRNSDSEEHQQSNLTEILPMGTTVYLYYETPANLESGAMLDNKTYGFSAGYDWGDRGNINVEVALAENNFQRKEITIEETHVQPGIDGQYRLIHSDIVEGSEVIRIKKIGTMGIILNRNSDYSINYIQGGFQFQTITVSSADVVNVEYRYYEAGDGARQVQQSSAYKVSGQYGLTDRVQVSGQSIVIDNTFDPVGTMTESSGTAAWKGRMDYTLGKNQHLFSQVENRRVYRPHSNDDSVYNNNQQILLGSDQWVWHGLETQFQYEYQRTTERQPASSNYKINEKMNRYQAKIGFGPEYLKTVMNAQQSAKIDTAQNQARYSGQHDIKTVYSQTNVLWMDAVNLTALYSRSHSKEALPDSSNTREVNTKKFLSVLKPNSAMHIQLDSIIDSIYTHTGQATYLDYVPDVTGKLTYTPYYWLSTNVQYRDKVYESAVLGQYGRQESRQLYQLERLEVYPMLVSFNVPWISQRLQVFRRSNLMASYSAFEQMQNNKLMRTQHNTLSITYRDFSPVSFMTIRKINVQTLLANTDNRMQTGDQQRSLSNSRTMALAGDVLFKHNRSFFRYWEYGYSFDNQRIDSDGLTRYQDAGLSETETIHSARDSQDTTHRLSFTPGSVHVAGVPMGPLATAIRWTQAISHYDSQTVDRSDAENQVIDYSEVSDIQTELTAAPYNRFRTRIDWGRKTQFLARTMTTEAQGTFLNREQDLSLSVSAPIAKQLELTTVIDWVRIGQHSKKNTVISKSDVQLPSQYDEQLVQYAYTYRADLDWQWQSWLSLTGGGGQLSKTESTHRPAETVTRKYAQFSQIVGRAGFVWRPWSFMDVDYDYSYKTAETSENPGTKMGESHAINVKLYKQKPLVSVDITMDWLYTTGQDFNTLDQSSLRSGAGIVTNIAIRNREDYIRNLSLNVAINVPARVQFLDKITVTGSGYFSSIMDHIESENSYDVGGVILTTRVDF